MIISDLCDEYAVLVSQNRAPAYGYDNVNAPYGLVVDDDGTLIRVRPLGDFSGKKPVNIIPVPARFPRSSGIVANFLCDNVTYLLGCDTKGNAKRAANCIDAYSMASRTVPPPPYAPSSRRRHNGRPPNVLWGMRHGNHR